MNATTARRAIECGELVWDIGQLDNAARHELALLVRAGYVVKGKAMWPDVFRGTCSKTVYASTAHQLADYIAH